MMEDAFRSEHRELSHWQADRVQFVKKAAQLVIDDIARAYPHINQEGQAQLCTGTMFLETAIMWITKGLSAEKVQ